MNLVPGLGIIQLSNELNFILNSFSFFVKTRNMTHFFIRKSEY